jgi:tRNA1(Val) A37 N6-methylase TrmN6
MGEDIIHLLNRRVRLHQPAGGFRSSMDTVLLAAACPARAGESVLDLGCGVGGAGLCVRARLGDLRLTGIDIQADQIALATRNAALNGFENCAFEHADIQTYARAPDGKNPLFDHVICNPPYNDDGSHTRSPSPAKALAMGHESTTLHDWVDCATRSLKAGGSLSLIHKADQIDKIMAALGGRYGAVDIIPFWPRRDEPAKRVIVRGLKDRKSPTTLHPGMVLHEESGEYTGQAEEILREAKSL